jgi:hypothetical protein
VGDQEKIAVLHLGLVLHDAVLRNADAELCGAEGTNPADHCSLFERAHDPHEKRRLNFGRTWLGASRWQI